MNNQPLKSSQRRIRSCVDCVCSNLAQSSLAGRLLGLCPLLAVTTSVLKAFSIAMLLLVVGALSTVIGTVFRSMVFWRFKPLYFAVLASISTLVVVNTVGIYFPLVVNSLGIYALLIAANCQVFSQLQESAEHGSISETLPRVVKDGCWILAFAIIIAAVREFAVHGVLFQDWPLVYGLPLHGDSIGPLPFLAQPAGALIVLSMMLGALNLYGHSKNGLSNDDDAQAQGLSENVEPETYG